MGRLQNNMDRIDGVTHSFRYSHNTNRHDFTSTGEEHNSTTSSRLREMVAAEKSVV